MFSRAATWSRRKMYISEKETCIKVRNHGNLKRTFALQEKNYNFKEKKALTFAVERNVANV